MDLTTRNYFIGQILCGMIAKGCVPIADCFTMACEQADELLVHLKEEKCPWCSSCGSTDEEHLSKDCPEDSGAWHEPTAAKVIAAVEDAGNHKGTTAKVIQEVHNERLRQQYTEGWTHAHDDAHTNGELVRAAAFYALHGYNHPAYLDGVWPFDWSWWKPKTTRQNLVRAAALLVAEIERLDRGGTVQPLQTLDKVLEAASSPKRDTSKMTPEQKALVERWEAIQAWKGPWPSNTNGPDHELALTAFGVMFTITPTNMFGGDSGRRRYHVMCDTCGKVLHEATTGPCSMIRSHLAHDEVHK